MNLQREIKEAINSSNNYYSNYNSDKQDFENYNDPALINEAIMEGLSLDEIKIISFIKKELQSIAKYPYEWFREMALNKLILTLYHNYEYQSYDSISDKIIDDLIEYLEDNKSLQKIKGRQK